MQRLSSPHTYIADGLQQRDAVRSTDLRTGSVTESSTLNINCLKINAAVNNRRTVNIIDTPVPTSSFPRRERLGSGGFDVPSVGLSLEKGLFQSPTLERGTMNEVLRM